MKLDVMLRAPLRDRLWDFRPRRGVVLQGLWYELHQARTPVFDQLQGQLMVLDPNKEWGPWGRRDGFL